jgi:hypothetical protein
MSKQAVLLGIIVVGRLMSPGWRLVLPAVLCAPAAQQLAFCYRGQLNCRFS